MSPRYEPDLTAVAATLELFEKGDFEFIIGEPKSFQRQNDKGQLSVGVRFPLALAEETNGHKKNSRQLFSCYIHTDGGMTFSKRFIMAALGYKGNSQGEREFDDKFKGADWSLDPDNGSVGDVWRQPAGRRITASLDIGTNPNSGEPSQQFTGFQPVSA